MQTILVCDDDKEIVEAIEIYLQQEGYAVGNIDATIIAQKPKLMPHIQKMRENIAEAMRLTLGQVSVKATTEERLGFTGREEGISAQAVCTLTGIYEASAPVAGSGGCSGCGGCPRK